MHLVGANGTARIGHASRKDAPERLSLMHALRAEKPRWMHALRAPEGVSSMHTLRADVGGRPRRECRSAPGADLADTLKGAPCSPSGTSRGTSRQAHRGNDDRGAAVIELCTLTGTRSPEPVGVRGREVANRSRRLDGLEGRGDTADAEDARAGTRHRARRADVCPSPTHTPLRCTSGCAHADSASTLDKGGPSRWEDGQAGKRAPEGRAGACCRTHSSDLQKRAGSRRREPWSSFQTRKRTGEVGLRRERSSPSPTRGVPPGVPTPMEMSGDCD